MKKNIILLFSLIAFSSLFISTECDARDPDMRRILMFTGYWDEGPYVEYPAILGQIIGAPLGLPVGVLLSSWDGGNLGATICNISSFIVGLPFYLTKKAFWDFPQLLMSQESKSDFNKIASPNGGPADVNSP